MSPLVVVLREHLGEVFFVLSVVDFLKANEIRVVGENLVHDEVLPVLPL